MLFRSYSWSFRGWRDHRLHWSAQPEKGPGVKEKAIDHHLREIADCLDEILRLQSRVMELTEQVSETAGMNPGDRTLRGKVTGLFFGVQAYLEELNRLAKDTA